MFLPCQVEIALNYNWTTTNTNEEGMAETSFEKLGVKVREQSNKKEVKTFCLVASMETIGFLRCSIKLDSQITTRWSKKYVC